MGVVEWGGSVADGGRKGMEKEEEREVEMRGGG